MAARAEFHREWLAEHYNPRGEPKKAFATWAEAQDAAAEGNRQNHGERPMHAYHCGYCDAFHIGHSNPNKRRRGRR